MDYAIKALEELICIMEGKKHQIVIVFRLVLFVSSLGFLFHRTLYNPRENERLAFGEEYDSGISEGISCMSETEYHISLTKAIAKEENEAELRKNFWLTEG